MQTARDFTTPKCRLDPVILTISTYVLFIIYYLSADLWQSEMTTRSLRGYF